MTLASSQPESLDNVSLKLEHLETTSVELTSSKLDQLFANIELSLPDDRKLLSPNDTLPETEALAIELLSHFGLKSSKDVIAFLRSPGGEIVLSIIEKELAELAAMNEDIQREKIEAFLLEKRILGFLLLGLLHKRQAMAQHLNDLSWESFREKIT